MVQFISPTWSSSVSTWCSVQYLWSSSVSTCPVQWWILLNWTTGLDHMNTTGLIFDLTKSIHDRLYIYTSWWTVFCIKPEHLAKPYQTWSLAGAINLFTSKLIVGQWIYSHLSSRLLYSYSHFLSQEFGYKYLHILDGFFLLHTLLQKQWWSHNYEPVSMCVHGQSACWISYSTFVRSMRF